MATTGSLAGSSAGRFLSGVLAAICGLLVGVMTARTLGPEGKGTLSTLIFVIALATPVCAFGLGEAGQVLLARERFSLQRLVSASLALVLLASAGAAGALVAAVAVGTGRPEAVAAAAAAAAALPLIVVITVLARLLDAAHEVAYVSAVRFAVAGATAVTTLLLVNLLRYGVPGALLAVAAASGLGAALLTCRLIQLGVRPLPRWDADLLRQALPSGFPSQMSYVVIVASTRVDLLVVASLVGSSAAGQYSVALTIGQLVPYAPMALTSAALPMIARLPHVEARALTARVCRAAVATGAVSAATVALLTPVVVPFAFGPGFRASVQPAIILCVAGIVYGAQLAACRAESGRGRPGVLLASFSVSLVVMVAGDLLLIPAAGLTGAALASLLSSVVGWFVAVGWPRPDAITPPASGFVPRRQDVAVGARLLRQIVRQGQPSRGDS